MKLEINLDIQSAIDTALSPEKLNPILQKVINEAITRAIDDATGYRSEFRKTLEEQLKTAMPHGLALDDVAKFQYLLNNAMNQMVGAANNDTVKTAMEKAVKNAMPDVPNRIKISELIKEARDGFHKDAHEAFYAKYRESKYGPGGWLSLDSDEDCRSEHSAEIQLAINESGDVYSLKMDGKQVTPTSLPNAIGRLEGLILSMYVGRTTIEIDIDEYEIESLATSQED